MSWSAKLAKSIQNDHSLDKHRYIAWICTLAITLSITTMLISSFLIRGFESKIEEKIFDFWSHIRIYPLTNEVNPVSDQPMLFEEKTIKLLRADKEIDKIIPVANKGAILKHKSNIEGLIMKGMNLDLIHKHFELEKTKHLPYNDAMMPVIISKKTAQRLNAKIGSTIFVNIIDSLPQTHKATVINIFSTNIEEFDQQFALADLKSIQKLNHWSNSEISWIEVYLKNPKSILAKSYDLYQKIPNFNVDNIYELFPQMFDWLSLMKRNELIIIIVMLIVACINILSTISIFILEKSKLIGMLKVLGAKQKDLSSLIFYQIKDIIIRGIIYGNSLAMLLTGIIYFFKPIKLDPSIYYVDHAPIKIDWSLWILINVLCLTVCFLFAYIPLQAIKRISPIKVAEFQ